MRFAERFGQGAASYVEVRDDFSASEAVAWLAYFEAWDAEESERKAAEEHRKTMAAAARALHRR